MTTPTALRPLRLTLATLTGSAWARTSCSGCARHLADTREARLRAEALHRLLLTAEDDRARQRAEIYALERQITPTSDDTVAG